MPWARLTRSAVGFGCWTDERSCGRTLSRRLAAATSGLSPLGTAAASPISVCSTVLGACGWAAAGAGRPPGVGRPPGTGMMTVRSTPRSANGSSGTAHRPELELEPGELAGDVHGQRPRLLRHFPEIAGAVQLEVEESRVVGDLTRRYRQAAQCDPRQVQIDEIPDALDGPDLHERRQARLEPLGLELRLRGQYEPRGLDQVAVGNG